MANNDEITRDQSFTGRTLKYGRNLMAVAVPIIVFALVPLVDLVKSRPLNFEIQEGGEVWLWRILLALLVYYGFRFFGLAIPDFLIWRKLHGTLRTDLKVDVDSQILAVKTEKNALATARQTDDKAFDDMQQTQWHSQIARSENKVLAVEKNLRNSCSALRDYKWRRTYFWFTDAGLPTVLFCLALWASICQISMLHGLIIPLNCAGGETP